MFFWRPSGDPA